MVFTIDLAIRDIRDHLHFPQLGSGGQGPVRDTWYVRRKADLLRHRLRASPTYLIMGFEEARRPIAKRDASRVLLAWNVLTAALSACGMSRDAARRALITREFNFVLNVSGAEPALDLLKRFSSRARQLWIENGERDFAAQLSYIGRALPEPTADVVAKALEQHRLDLSSHFETQPHRLESLAKFVRSWCGKHSMHPGRMPRPDFPGLGACLEKTVRQGGLRQAVAEMGPHPDAEAFAPQLLKELPPQDVQDLVSDLTLIAHGRDYLHGHLATRLPVAKVVALAVRGLKARVVTKSEAKLHLLGHVARKRLLGGLRRDPSTRDTLQGIKDDDIVNMFTGVRGNLVVSTDLRAASDLIPLDAAWTMVEAMRPRVTRLEHSALCALTGPQLITSGKGPQGSFTYTSTRGLLMGLPSTWALLSLLHIHWWEEAIREVGRATRRSRRHMAIYNRYMVCGDDGLSVCEPAVADAYERIAGAFGAELSPGKHFRSKVGLDGVARGVFLERLLDFHFSAEGVVLAVRRVDAVPLKGLFSPDHPPQAVRRAIGELVRFPASLRTLAAFDAIRLEHPGGNTNLLRIVKSHYPYLLRVAKELGLPAGIPIRQGGSGLPLEPGQVADQEYLVRARLANAEGHNFSVKLVAEVSPLWQMSSAIAGESIQEFLEDGTFVVPTPQSDPDEPPEPSEGLPYVRGPPMELLTTQATSSIYRSMALFMPDEVKDVHISFRQVAASLTKWREALASVALPPREDWPSVLASDFSVPIWIRRTQGPAGLLYPRWCGEHLASEARLRSTCADALLPSDRPGH